MLKCDAARPAVAISQVLIHQYLAQLDVLKKVSGTHRESVVREAFKDRLKGWGKQHDLAFIAEYKLDSATKDARFVDGALLEHFRGSPAKHKHKHKHKYQEELHANEVAILPYCVANLNI